MTYFTDSHKTVDITLTGINGVEWQDDFYNVCRLTDLADAEGYEALYSLYVVEDVDNLIAQAHDLIAGEGDYALDGPNGSTLSVCELDPDDKEEAAILAYVKAHPKVVALVQQGVLGLDESLFRTALRNYEMDEDGDEYRLSIPALADVDLVVRLIPGKGIANAYVAYPGGERRLGWMAYEDCVDSDDVDDWLDAKLNAAADYVPDGPSIQGELALLGYRREDVEDRLGYAYWVSPTGDRVRVLSSETLRLVAVEALDKEGRARWSLRRDHFDSSRELIESAWRLLTGVEE